MSVPVYQELMLPLLRLLSDGGMRSMAELREALAARFSLSELDRNVMLPSGRARLFDNHVGWARTYLGQAGLVDSPSRGNIQITDRGRQLLGTNPPKLSRTLLLQYPEFVAFTQRTRNASITPSAPAAVSVPPEGDEETPDEAIERAYAALSATLGGEILTKLLGLSPQFFENSVIDLLLAMGYGGSWKDAAQVVGQSGDGGIDGLIKEDKLGLDRIYIQAKRWSGTVGRPEVQSFAGSLAGRQANRGIFITTSAFSQEARQYIEHLPMRIVLIDGQQLASLMIEHNVGVSIASTFEIKRINSDYFTDE